MIRLTCKILVLVLFISSTLSAISASNDKEIYVTLKIEGEDVYRENEDYYRIPVPNDDFNLILTFNNPTQDFVKLENVFCVLNVNSEDIEEINLGDIHIDPDDNESRKLRFDQYGNLTEGAVNEIKITLYGKTGDRKVTIKNLKDTAQPDPLKIYYYQKGVDGSGGPNFWERHPTLEKYRDGIIIGVIVGLFLLVIGIFLKGGKK